VITAGVAAPPPPELLKAHRDLDRAVMRLYGFPTRAGEFSEAECVARLMERYREMTEKKCYM